MKKLLILLIAFLTFLTLPGLQTQAALTPPASYDYSFVYDATDNEFQFKDDTNSYTPEFTRTADGIYFNYTYTGNADGLLPFEVTLTFNRSNTSWTFGTTGYIATDTKIGSDATVGSTRKNIYLFNNTTNNDFLYYIDVSSSTSDIYVLETNGYNIATYINNVYFTASHMNILWSSALSINEIKSNITNTTEYIDSLYWLDLGTSAAVQTTTGYISGYDDGFGDGYLTGVAEDNAYSIGYAKGLIDGGDMETGSSIIVLVLAALSFGFMIFGFSSRKRIFNLFAAGLFIALGGLMVEYAAFIIISIGFVIFNIWYTFASD